MHQLNTPQPLDSRIQPQITPAEGYDDNLTNSIHRDVEQITLTYADRHQASALCSLLETFRQATAPEDLIEIAINHAFTFTDEFEAARDNALGRKVN